MKFAWLLVCASGLLLCGCATPYQHKSFRGGYSETLLAPDVYRIVFQGNGYTSADRVQDFALLRAAELTLEHGFTCFALLDEKNTTTVSTFTTPGYANTTTTGTATGYGYGYASVHMNSSTTYTPPQTYAIYKPHTGLLVGAFKTKPADVYTFDSTFLLKSIRTKYKIKNPEIAPDSAKTNTPTK